MKIIYIRKKYFIYFFVVLALGIGSIGYTNKNQNVISVSSTPVTNKIIVVDARASDFPIMAHKVHLVQLNRD